MTEEKNDMFAAEYLFIARYSILDALAYSTNTRRLKIEVEFCIETLQELRSKLEKEEQVGRKRDEMD